MLGLKFAAVLLVALLLSFRDLEILPTDNGWWLAFWAAIAFVIGVPWGMLQELGSMSGYTMTATLRITDGRLDELAPHASSPAPARVGPARSPSVVAPGTASSRRCWCEYDGWSSAGSCGSCPAARGRRGRGPALVQRP